MGNENSFAGGNDMMIKADKPARPSTAPNRPASPGAKAKSDAPFNMLADPKSNGISLL
jgi:hypothetical protein